MVDALESIDDEYMSRLLSPPNGAHLMVIAIALIARAVLGAIPVIGGILGFALLLVALYHGYKVATNLIGERA